MPVALGLRVGSSVSRQGARDGRESLREFGTRRRHGLRYEPSSRQSARRPTLLVTGRVQASLEDLYRQFAVHTLGVLVSTERKIGRDD